MARGPKLLEADPDAEYAAVIEIDMDQIKEPILCAPNDPDDARSLSEVTGDKVDEVFIGSCMTNIGHFRAAGKLLKEFDGQLPTRLWVAPHEDGRGAAHRGGVLLRLWLRRREDEMPGCSLCMGNQARVAEKSTVVSTSTRNFPNRLGKGANVYLASAELAAVSAILGRLPTPAEYLEYAGKLDATASDTYRYLNFDELPQYVESADKVTMEDEAYAGLGPAMREQLLKVAKEKKAAKAAA